jgi:hypothetical protein
MFKRRTRSETPSTAPTSLFERVMFSFMGPPELGEDKAPEGFRPDPAQDLCHKCAQPWDRHERVHTGTMTYLRCPDPG